MLPHKPDLGRDKIKHWGTVHTHVTSHIRHWLGMWTAYCSLFIYYTHTLTRPGHRENTVWWEAYPECVSTYIEWVLQTGSLDSENVCTLGDTAAMVLHQPVTYNKVMQDSEKNCVSWWESVNFWYWRLYYHAVTLHSLQFPHPHPLRHAGHNTTVIVRLLLLEGLKGRGGERREGCEFSTGIMAWLPFTQNSIFHLALHNTLPILPWNTRPYFTHFHFPDKLAVPHTKWWLRISPMTTMSFTTSLLHSQPSHPLHIDWKTS